MCDHVSNKANSIKPSEKNSNSACHWHDAVTTSVYMKSLIYTDKECCFRRRTRFVLFSLFQLADKNLLSMLLRYIWFQLFYVSCYRMRISMAGQLTLISGLSSDNFNIYAAVIFDCFVFFVCLETLINTEHVSSKRII